MLPKITPVIRFENVTKVYSKTDRPALDNVSIDIEKGEFVFLVGLSGKTVDVIGSGPAGLAAAQQLTRAGHTVAVY